MTTLKFIDELIYCTERNITKTNNDLELYKENNRYSEQLKFQLEALENRLKYLLKVKEELEVLEICKNDPVIIYTLKTLAKGESINWHRLSEEQQEKIKKVVEIK